MTAEACKLKGSFWIKPPDEAYRHKRLKSDLKENRFVYYQLILDLDDPAELILSISANSRYRLWINGEAVCSGPCRGDRWRHYYETIDVSARLRSGVNVFSVQVWSLNTYMINDPRHAQQPLFTIASLPVGPRLAVSGICLNRGGKMIADLATGQAQWLACVDDAITTESDEQYTIFMGAIAERVLAQRLPGGWKRPDQPDDAWFQAAKAEPCLGAGDEHPLFIVPQLLLVQRPIPLLDERLREFKREMSAKLEPGCLLLSFGIGGSHVRDGVEIPPYSSAVVELDAGELTTGYPVYPMQSGAEACVKIRYAERYFQPGNEKANTVRDDAVNGEIMGFEDIYYPAGASAAYEPFWLRTFRFIRIEVTTGSEAMILGRPWYRESVYPLQPKTTITSSESWIDPLWKISLRTLQLCMHETYEDCPYYEQMQFIMDTRLQALFTYSVGGHTGLVAKALEDFHSSLLPEGITQDRFPSAVAQIIPSFSLHFVFMLLDYYWQTGDTGFIRRYRSTVDSILEWFERKIGQSGLVEKIGYWEFIDWVPEWQEGEPSACKAGPSTIHNLVYASALQAGAELNRATGRDGVADEYLRRSSSILNQIERSCWSEQWGMYREGPGFEQYTQHAQVWAVLSGLCQGEKAKRVMTGALDNPGVLKCSFSMSFFLFRALEQAELYDRTEQLWQSWINLLPLHVTTLPETPFQPRSDCHAWSALPLYEFTHSLLGVKCAKPGWGEIVIEPHTLNLPEMSGHLHTPAGDVSVSWRRTSSEFSIWGQVPDGVPFRLCWNGMMDERYEDGGSFKATVSLQ